MVTTGETNKTFDTIVNLTSMFQEEHKGNYIPLSNVAQFEYNRKEHIW